MFDEVKGRKAMIKKKKLMALLLAGTMLAFSVLAGCGDSNQAPQNDNNDNSQEDQGGQADQGGQEEQPEDNGGQTAGDGGSVTLWMHNGPAFVEATKALADRFKEETGITVDIQIFPYDVMSQKMQTAYSAGNEPDIIQAFGSWLPSYVNQGMLAAVPDDYAATFDTDFFEGATEGLKKDGKYYGVPIELQCEYGLFYVPEKVKEAGIADGKPDNFEEVVQVGKNAAKFNGDVLEYGGLEFDNGDNVAQMFLSWILQYGGEFWDESGTHMKLQTEEGQKAWQRLVDLVAVDKVTDLKHVTPELGTDMFFFNQKAAQLIKGSWASAYEEQFDFHDWEYCFFPPVEGDVPTFVVETGWTYVVSEKSANKDNAFKFVEFCLRPENAMEFNMATITIPALKAVAEDPAFTDAEANVRFKDQYQYLKYSQNVGPVQDMDFVKKLVQDTLRGQVDGSYTTESALEYMETEINKHIDTLLSQAG